MTLKDFEKRLKALLMEAIESGHSVDEIGELAESVLQGEWSDTD